MKRVFAFVGFSSAITLIVLNTVPYFFVKFILIFAVVSLLISLLVKSLRQERVVPITFGAMLFSCLIFVLYMQCDVIPQKSLDGISTDVKFRIVDIEEETDSGYLYTVKTESIDAFDSPQNIKLKIKSQTKIPADYYNTVSAMISFYSYTDNAFCSFGDYGNDIYVRGKLIQIDDVTEHAKPPNYYILKLRLKIKEIITENFDEEKAGLAYSILTGDKGLLRDDIRESFKVCGISHMIAVSGLHITLICLLAYYLLKFLKVPILPSTVLTFLIIIVYISVSGYSKSAVRAGIMIAVMLTARLVNDKADTLNSLGFAVFIMCLNPFSVTDAGALLTVTAIIGLCVIKPAYDKKLRPENKILGYFYDGVFSTWSVLLSTLPVGWLLFSRLSLVSLVMNILCIPIMQLALVSVLLVCIFSGVPFLVFIPKHIADFSLGVLINVSDFCEEKFSILYIDISDELVGVAIAALLLFAGISLLVSHKIDIKLMSVFIALILSVTAAFSIYSYNYNAYVRVSDSGAVMIYDKDSAVIIDADDKSDCYFMDDVLSARNLDSVVAYNSVSCKKEIRKLLPDAEFKSLSDCDENVCNHISIKCDNDVILVSVFDKVFKIDENYVRIGEYKAYRNIYDRFNETGDVMFIITENADVQIKEGK